jgi:hypothetical protein
MHIILNTANSNFESDCLFLNEIVPGVLNNAGCNIKVGTPHLNENSSNYIREKSDGNEFF